MKDLRAPSKNSGAAAREAMRRYAGEYPEKNFEGQDVVREIEASSTLAIEAPDSSSTSGSAHTSAVDTTTSTANASVCGEASSSASADTTHAEANASSEATQETSNESSKTESGKKGKSVGLDESTRSFLEVGPGRKCLRKNSNIAPESLVQGVLAEDNAPENQSDVSSTNEMPGAKNHLQEDATLPPS